MKLVLKTLKQVPHEVEVSSGDCTVQELKVQTEKSHNIDHETIKLVFNGVVLKDENTLNSYNIHDGNTIIMMINKTKVLNKPVEEVKKEESKKVEVKHDDIIVEEGNNKNNGSNNNSSSLNDNNQQNNQQSQPNYSDQVKTLVEMGFPQEYSEAAIKAAKGNVSLAIEFLYNGIPQNIENNIGNNGNNGNNTGNQGGNNSGSQPTSSLDAVKRIAQIIKVLCANDPSQLQNIIMELQQSRPELIELIKQHENEFKTIIQSEVTDEDLKVFSDFNSELGLGGSGQGQGQGRGQGQGQGQRGEQIKLSKEEYEAIQRLKAYGFSELDCVQAYFAFDKNEEMALNFLFDMKGQDNFDDGNNINNNNK